MSQYKDGSVSVTNGSATVTGVSTAFLANAAVGDSFKIQGENATYNITAVGSNTSLTVSPVYAGTTKTGQAYVISKDFTPNWGLYEPSGSDVDWPFLLTQALRIIDTNIPGYIASQTPGANNIVVVGADGYTRLGGITAAAGSALPFKAGNGSEAMRVDNAGNLLVGVTSGNYHRLYKAASQDWAVEIANSGTVNPYGLLLSFPTITTASTGSFIFCNDGGATRMLVSGNGNIQNANNSYGAFSDLKLKENITPARSYWDDYKQLEWVNYNLKADPAGNKLLGGIAQQFETVFPAVVEESQDMAERQVEIDGVLQFNEDETPKMERYATGEVTKGIKYSIVNTIGEIVLQEAQARIETLEQENDILKTTLANVLERLAILENS